MAVATRPLCRVIHPFQFAQRQVRGPQIAEPAIHLTGGALQVQRSERTILLQRICQQGPSDGAQVIVRQVEDGQRSVAFQRCSKAVRPVRGLDVFRKVQRAERGVRLQRVCNGVGPGPGDAVVGGVEPPQLGARPQQAREVACAFRTQVVETQVLRG